jgi:hypothetical protein
MRTVSLDKVLNITIHNQCPDLELTSPVYISDGTTYCVSPNQQANTGNIMKTSFGIDSKKKDLKCVSLYKLQRKRATKADKQHNINNASIEDTATNKYLLVAWVVKNYHYEYCAHLIEFTDDFAWDEDKLWALYREYNNQFHMDDEPRIITWLMHDNTMVKTEINVKYELDYKLNVVLSEATDKYDIEGPMKINPKRLVLSSPMLIILIYATRLNIRPSFKLNIYNQCLNVDLVSLTYITGNELECHRSPNHNACAGDTMRSGFIIKSNDASYGVLMYKLQKRQSHEFTEIGEGTSSATYLLVVWDISKYKTLYADVLLVKHDKGFAWEKGDLEELYRKNSDQFRLCPDPVTETWSLDDNIALMTAFEIIDEDHTLDITISEVERDNNTRMPVHIDLER